MLVPTASFVLAVASVSGCQLPRSGYVYNVIIDDGITNNKQYLSVNGDGSNVDLWTHDDYSGRQQWALENRGDYWYFDIAGGVSGNRDVLSVNGDGSVVDLWTHDDVSGRQRWRISDAAGADDAYCNIEIYGGVSSTRKYLSTTSNGDNVDLWTYDDGSGRQRWRFVELKKAQTLALNDLNDGNDGNDANRFIFVFESEWTPIVSFVLALVLTANAVWACCYCSRSSPYQKVKVFGRDSEVECV